MLNPNFAQKFIDKEHERVLALFAEYQMIETLLFLHLYPGQIITPARENAEFEKLNEEMNSKTMGKMKQKYLELYPKDKLNLASALQAVIPQRNSFMHSLWIFLSACATEEQAMEYGELILVDFQKNADKLFDAITAAKFD